MRRPSFRLAVAASLLAVSAASAQTTTYIWDGGGSNSLWSNADNWGGTVPASNLSAT